MHGSLRFVRLALLCLLVLAVACQGSSPTGPGGSPGGTPGGTTFSGPTGYLEANGSSRFGPRFEPGAVQLMEIGIARALHYVQDDERLVSVFFNTTNLLVTRVMAGVVLDTGDDGWNLDNGIGVPVSGVTVIPDGDEWIVRFEHTVLPPALGTTEQLTLYGELRSDL